MAGLALLLPPCYHDFKARARLHFYASCTKSITTGLRMFAGEYKGRFPFEDDQERAFTTSTDAFGHMMKKGGITSDEIFYIRSNPLKPQEPNNDGTLLPSENCLSYVTNQSLSDWELSPLVAHEMTGVGTYGENHPFLKSRRAIVGYVGGHARIEKLSSSKPGATIPGPPDSGIDNIFEQGTKLEDGTFKDGFLAVPTSNILHPQ